MGTQAQHVARNAIHWFEIPVRDLARAERFYAALVGRALRRDPMAGDSMAMFAYDDGGDGYGDGVDGGGVGGALCALGPGDPPLAAGGGATIVYLDVGPSLDAALARAEQAGARIATPRTELPDGLGVFAHIIDLDGNRIGVHAMA